VESYSTVVEALAVEASSRHDDNPNLVPLRRQTILFESGVGEHTHTCDVHGNGMCKCLGVCKGYLPSKQGFVG
jgi:hypothetical protein